MDPVATPVRSAGRMRAKTRQWAVAHTAHGSRRRWPDAVQKQTNKGSRSSCFRSPHRTMDTTSPRRPQPAASQINGELRSPRPLGWVRGTCTMRTARKQPANYWRSVRAIDPASGRRHGAVREDDTDGPRRRSAQQPRARGAGPAPSGPVATEPRRCRGWPSGASLLAGNYPMGPPPSSFGNHTIPLLGSCAREILQLQSHGLSASIILFHHEISTGESLPFES